MHMFVQIIWAAVFIQYRKQDVIVTLEKLDVSQQQIYLKSLYV